MDLLNYYTTIRSLASACSVSKFVTSRCKTCVNATLIIALEEIMVNFVWCVQVCVPQSLESTQLYHYAT